MKGTPVTGVARRIDRACKHVSDLWFPADPGLVSRLRNTLAKDPSPSSIDETLEILSGDYSLYIFALKELVKILGDEGVAVSEIPSPREILEKAGLDTLRNVLNDSEDRLSQHSLDGMESAQVARMREALVSASASGTLANAQLQNQDLGFFTGLLRQLGLTLIAFNYPSVYQRATAAVRQGKEIDESITEILGFSPSTLAIALAKQWNLPAGLCSVLDDDPEDIDRDIETNALGRSLRELCRIGEALSRANEPETYPTARADWDFAERAITEKLGVNGLATIREAIEDRFEQLIVQAPSLFRGGTILDPEAFIAKHYEDEMGRHNPLVKSCRLHVQEKILELYHGLAEGQSTQALLRKFSNVTVPSCGFSGGAVFTVDPGSLNLTPQLRIGSLQARSFNPVSIELTENDDFVANSFKSDELVTCSVCKVNEASIALLGAVFGYSQRVGILYLEIPEIVFAGSEQQHRTHLRALAITLTDLLRLS